MTRAMLQQGQLPAEFQVQTAAAFMSDGVFRARGGVLPIGPGGPTCTATATASGSVAVSSLAAVVPGTGTTPGAFFYAQPSDTLDILGAHPAASQDRIDLVGVQVTTGGATEQTVLASVTGTPSSIPTVPAAPENFLPLWRVAVKASALAIQSSAITPVWQYTALRGANLVVANRTARNAVPTAQLVPGQTCWCAAEQVTDTWTGAAWQQADTGWKTLPLYPNWSAYSAVHANWQTPQYRISNGWAAFRGVLRPAFITGNQTWNPGAGNDILVVPNDARQGGVNGEQIKSVRAGLATGTGSIRCDYRIASDGTHRLYLIDADGTGYTMNLNSWVSLDDLSWPVA